MGKPKKKLSDLNEAGRESLALAIHLWRDFMSNGQLDIKIVEDAVGFADMLGVRKEWDAMHAKLPPSHEIFKFRRGA